MIAEAKHISKGPNNRIKVSANVVQEVMTHSMIFSIVKEKRLPPITCKDRLSRVDDEDEADGKFVIDAVFGWWYCSRSDKTRFFIADHDVARFLL